MTDNAPRYQAKMYWMNWWVFDTASKLPNGERRAICMCTTEHEAKFICNALNTNTWVPPSSSTQQKGATDECN